jgi:hypothetical protein
MQAGKGGMQLQAGRGACNNQPQHAAACSPRCGSTHQLHHSAAWPELCWGLLLLQGRRQELRQVQATLPSLEAALIHPSYQVVGCHPVVC